MISTMIKHLGEVFENKKVASLMSAKTVQTSNSTIMGCSSLFAQININLVIVKRVLVTGMS
jgi:hypothetical protein